ncbi:MAG: carboxypeptidase regulatory-like domain-containing protein [Candidatus Glassbacteria bacterium]
MDRFLDDFGQTNFENLALIRYHVWWPSNTDPFYLETSGLVGARVNYYDVIWVPWPLVDGTYAASNSAFQYMFDQRISEGSPLVMGIEAEAIGDSIDIDVTVIAEEDPGAGNLRIRIVACETDLHYHSPYGDVWNEVMRTMVPDAGGEAFEISQGDTLHFNNWFRMQPHWAMVNMSVVAFVQSSDTDEILQGARWLPPAGVVTGVVEDQSQTPVEDALVTLLETGRFDSTDAQGEFTLSYLVGNYEIETIAVGYYPDTTTVEIFDDSTVTVGITLNELPTGLCAGTVTDEATGEGIAAKVVIMMRDEPWDSTETNPSTGFFYFLGLPISYPGVMEYTGIEIYPEMPYPNTSVDQVITITEDDTATLLSTLNPAEVLLVDDDEGLGYETYFIPAIDSAGRTYVHLDAFTSSTPPNEALSLFPASTKVVWFSGDATTSTLTQDDQDSLAAFLEAGGKLFVTGQNIAEELTSLQSPFLQDYLHTSWVGNASEPFTRGNSADPLGRNTKYIITAGSNGANNQTSRDKLELLPGANEVAYYVRSPYDPTPLGSAGIWAEGPVEGSRIVMLGFGFEAVNRPSGDEDQVTRSQLMRLVLDFLDGITSVEEPEWAEHPLLPRSYALSQNYPNPFNPQTTIVYDVPSSVGEGIRVLLCVYNLRGKKVKTLVDSFKKPGSHLAQWDGKNDKGERLSSGVYFYRLEAGDFVETRKLVLLE